ncbi:hypothetical protein C1X20_23260 [Pseudomonas sp. FW305-3-2-15-C-LB3]|nr:hypothetical protein C1X22_22705 [Pseudomonas sp. DP16D-L5]PMV60184.1 hypothetical protein C1X20_23260 [Pseudomonas sp. FW305-3-2-15-C-LB3]
MIATVLNPLLGYDCVAQITRKTAVQLGLITAEEYERQVQPERMISPDWSRNVAAHNQPRDECACFSFITYSRLTQLNLPSSAPLLPLPSVPISSSFIRPGRLRSSAASSDISVGGLFSASRFKLSKLM